MRSRPSSNGSWAIRKKSTASDCRAISSSLPHPPSLSLPRSRRVVPGPLDSAPRDPPGHPSRPTMQRAALGGVTLLRVQDDPANDFIPLREEPLHDNGEDETADPHDTDDPRD